MIDEQSTAGVIMNKNRENLELEARNRIKDLIILQRKLSAMYGEDNYNIFVFGSYPTIRYESGKSDVDVAVYTPDLDLYKNIAIEIENFFDERNIAVDLFYIDISIPAPIYLAPLHAQIEFTEYYPDELKDFEKRCDDELTKIKELLQIKSINSLT